MGDQRDVWNNIAASWNEYRQKIPPTVKDFVKRTHGRLLDLGCGSGRNFWRVRGQELYGVDFSKNMIVLARENAKRKRIVGKFSVMDVDNLDFEDNFFDGVLFWAVLHCVESREKRIAALREIHRVLKRGGEALISSWGSSSPRLKNKDKELFVPWTAEGDVKEMRYTYVYDFDEFVLDLREVGFEIEESWEDNNVIALVKKKF